MNKDNGNLNNREFKAPIEDLVTAIIEISKKEKDNMSLRQDMNKALSKKGLDIKLATLIFNEEINIEENSLDDIELICLCKAIYKNKNCEMELFNPRRYFYDSQLAQYDLYQSVEEEPMKNVVFENCIKIDEFNYFAVKDSASFAKMRKDRMLMYYSAIQRNPKIVRLSNGTIRVRQNINKKGLADLIARFTKKNLRPTAIAFAVLERPNKNPKVKFIPYNVSRTKEAREIFETKDFEETPVNNSGDLVIEPNFNISDEDCTELICVDGWHRYSGICDAEDNAIRNNKESLNQHLGVFIHIMTVDEAKQYISDVFKRSDTDISWTRAMNPTDGQKFVTSMIEKSKVLNKNVANTSQEMKAFHKITNMGVLLDAIEQTDIPVNEERKSIRISRKMAEIIDEILNIIQQDYLDNSYDKLKNSIYMLPNIFIGYVYVANELRKIENKEEYLEKIDEAILRLTNNINTEVAMELKLDKSKYSIKRIIEFFQKNILAEGEKNVK